MAERGRKPKYSAKGYLNEYLSYDKCGIDTAQFYRDMGTNISQVSRETGICRQTLTRFIADSTCDDTQNRVLSNLEECIMNDYRKTIQESRKDIENARKRLVDAWELYLKRDDMLEEYRKKYHIERKHPIERQVTEEEVFETKSG